jgi:hypothetical protein
MTPGERALWLAVFGASWHQSTGGPMGHMIDARRCEWCVAQADRAVAAMMALISDLQATETGARLAEVLE